LSTQAPADRTRPAGLTFAAVVLISIGCARVLSAIYYFADSNRVNNVEGGAFSHHLFVWGFWDLIIAALALTAGFSLLKGNELGFNLGYGFAGLAIIQSFLMLAADPWYAFAALLVAILIIYALATNDKKGTGYR
jgi:hypothetical protein